MGFESHLILHFASVPNRQRECAETASSARSSRARRTNSLRYASGEAARLSIGREGFDLPTERQFPHGGSRERYFPFAAPSDLLLRFMSMVWVRL